MITKGNLELLIKCVEVCQQSGKIGADAMVPVGIAYNNAKQTIEGMDEGDCLILFHPSEKKDFPATVPVVAKADMTEEVPKELKKGK